MKTKEELKLYFENGDIPKQEDFWEWQNSYWHKDEKLPNSSLEVSVYEEFIFSPTDNTEIIGSDTVMAFPEGVKVIGGFSYLLPLKRTSKIIFPKSLERIKNRAFSGQYLKGTLTIPGSCKIVEAFAFSSTAANLSKLVLENGIETIEEAAFQLTTSKDLTDLYIPKSVKSVGQNAFNIPALKTVSVKQGLDISNAGIPATATILYYTDI
ncbi:leucine rich repeat (LRR) protein [Chryseobacterium sp. 7]|uniref:leucine-rich repeat domain-containing protein n=1 Tax=Chryseobacterium sp. 7 TaxID=2035214 RepID=UPI000EAF4CDB|nr:leucine-rich repeat domain-containing protein [Chryseobacterium sp. 7]RLJ31056.1 leucine rich repeat (LRR) protein [Chryseobacterium sp. 7]